MNLLDYEVFGLGIQVFEINPKTRVSPTFSVATDLSRLIYKELSIDHPSLDRILLPEDLDYYVTAMIWLRIISLKIKNNDPLTETEQNVEELFAQTVYNLPEPLELYLLTFGNIVTCLGTHLYPEFPALPEASVAWSSHPQLVPGVPGFYQNGDVNTETHNLYEEVPTLGMALASLVKVQSGQVGDWTPPCNPANYVPTENLLNYRPITVSRVEALKHLECAGISGTSIQNDPPKTGLNRCLLDYVSSQLASLRRFNLSQVEVMSMSEVGSVAQMAQVHPLPGTKRCALGDVVVKTLGREKDSTIEVALAYCPCLYKTASDTGDEAWSCYVSDTSARTAPAEWADNRNQRRQIHLHDHAEYYSNSFKATYVRDDLVTRLVQTAR